MDIKTIIRTYNEVWKTKVDEEALIKKYHRDTLIGDESIRRKKQLRAGQAVRLIQNMESSDQTEKATYDELLRAWNYYFVCINGYKYWLDTEAARVDLGIEELQKKYK